MPRICGSFISNWRLMVDDRNHEKHADLDFFNLGVVLPGLYLIVKILRAMTLVGEPKPNPADVIIM